MPVGSGLQWVLECDLCGVAAKRADVCFDPVEGSDLVLAAQRCVSAYTAVRASVITNGVHMSVTAALIKQCFCI